MPAGRIAADSWGVLHGDSRPDPSEPARARPRWLAACLDLLHADYATPLTLAGVAARVGVHPVHLSRAFRQRFGQTLGEYVNRLRVRSACEQLRRARPPALVEVALMTGFADQSHLCRVFKRLVGCSPGRYRERCVRAGLGP